MLSAAMCYGCIMRTTLALFLVIAVALPAGAALGRDRGRRGDDQEQARAALQRGEVLPIARILALVAQYLPGDVIEVKLEQRRDRLRYEIKVLTQTGRVRELMLDARDGAFITIED